MPMTHGKRTFFADIFLHRLWVGSGPSAQITRIDINTILYPSRIVLVTRNFQRKINCLFRSCDVDGALSRTLVSRGLAFQMRGQISMVIPFFSIWR